MANEDVFTIDGARAYLARFKEELQKYVPDPAERRIIRLDQEYTPPELQDMLQTVGSYLSNLHARVSEIKAEVHIIKEGYRTGINVAISKGEFEATTQIGKEAELIVQNSGFKDLKRMQIEAEACLMLIEGWRDSYEAAYTTISRIISLRIGEASMQAGR